VFIYGETNTTIINFTTMLCCEASLDLLSVKTLPSRLRYFSEKFPDLECFAFCNNTERHSITWGMLYDLAGRFAWRLRHWSQRGFEKGDVIANCLPNSPERLITDVGIVFAGCIPMNGQVLLADGEDFYLTARQSRCKAVLVCPREGMKAWRLLGPKVKKVKQGGVMEGQEKAAGSNVSQSAQQQEMFKEMFQEMACEEAPEMTCAILVDRVRDSPTLVESLTSGDPLTYIADIDPADLMGVVTSSGSTGFSKLVGRGHGHMFGAFGERENGQLNNLEENVLKGPTFSDRPMGWIGGYPADTYIQGKRRVYLDRLGVDALEDIPGLVWRIVQTEQCPLTALVASDFFELFNHVTSSSDVISKAETVLINSQPIKKTLMVDLLKLFKTVLLSYGSTECSAISFKKVTDAEDFEDYCCGFPAYPDSVRIVNAELQDCKPGEIGTILVKSYDVLDGYFTKLDDRSRRPATSFLPNGWFNTEDAGYWGGPGHDQIHVIGRQNDVITYGCHVVYPGWLERKLTGHPGVKDVLVVPVSDPLIHHNIAACVQPSRQGREMTEDDLIADLRKFTDSVFLNPSGGNHGDKTPKPKYYMVMPELPLTASGKVSRKDVREIAEARFGSTAV